MIRKLLLLSVCILASLQLHADNRSRAFLDGLIGKLGGGAYEVAFTAEMEDEFEDVEGTIIVDGDKFYIQVDNTEMYFNGNMLQTYNSMYNEVIIEAPNPNDPSLLSNPSRFFRLSDTDFDHELSPENPDAAILTPKSKGTGYTSIVIQVDRISRLPVSIVSIVDGASTPIVIRIDKVTTGIKANPSVFTFDKSKHRGVEEIDLR